MYSEWGDVIGWLSLVSLILPMAIRRDDSKWWMIGVGRWIFTIAIMSLVVGLTPVFTRGRVILDQVLGAVDSNSNAGNTFVKDLSKNWGDFIQVAGTSVLIMAFLKYVRKHRITFLIALMRLRGVCGLAALVWGSLYLYEVQDVARSEKKLDQSLQSMLVREGPDDAALLGKTWPGVIPTNAQ